MVAEPAGALVAGSVDAVKAAGSEQAEAAEPPSVSEHASVEVLDSSALIAEAVAVAELAAAAMAAVEHIHIQPPLTRISATKGNESHLSKVEDDAPIADY